MGDRKVFSIPSVSEIKQANEISANGSKPSLFKSSVSLDPQNKKKTASQVSEASTTSLKPHQHDARRSQTDEAAKRIQVKAMPIAREAPMHRHRTHLGSSITGSTDPRPNHANTTQSNAASKSIHGSTSTDTPLGSGFIPSSSTASKQGGTTVMKPNDASNSTSSKSVSGDSTAAYRPHAILANAVQKQNPIMKHICNVPWELSNIVPDFELGRTTCALFLSVRYHSLHPNYIHERLKELGKQYELRVLLVLVDTSESQKVLQELAKIALLADLTLILAWSYEEAARYLETYKAYENKPPDLLMERVDSDFSSRVTDSLTTIKKVNKTDAATLLGTFKTMEKLITSSKEELTLCPGLGPQKAQRLHDLFHEPFRKSKRLKLDADDTR